MIEYVVVGGMVYCGYQMMVTTKEWIALQKEGKRLVRLRHMVENIPTGTDFFAELVKAIKQDVVENPSYYKGVVCPSATMTSHSKPAEDIKITYSFSL